MKDTESREKARAHGRGVHGYIDMETGSEEWYHVYSDGRVRSIPSDKPRDHPFLPPGKQRPEHLRHPAYTLGYQHAVSYEYQLLMSDFFSPKDYWRSDVLDLADGLIYPNQRVESDSYENLVAYWQSIATAVKRARPELIGAL